MDLRQKKSWHDSYPIFNSFKPMRFAAAKKQKQASKFNAFDLSSTKAALLKKKLQKKYTKLQKFTNRSFLLNLFLLLLFIPVFSAQNQQKCIHMILK
jgi:hypothetical protein